MAHKFSLPSFHLHMSDGLAGTVTVVAPLLFLVGLAMLIHHFVTGG